MMDETDHKKTVTELRNKLIKKLRKRASGVRFYGYKCLLSVVNNPFL